MRLRIPRPSLWLPWLFLTLLLPSPGEPAAKITDIVVTHSSDSLLVFATLKDAFSKEIEEGIVNGVQTSFTYYLRLMRQRGFWADEEVASLTVSQSVVYDVLKDRFHFSMEAGNQKLNRVTNNYGEIQRWMSSLEGIKLASIRELKRDELYYVQVRAEIRSVRLAFPLNVLLFFVSFWNVDTPWTSSDLFRVGK